MSSEYYRRTTCRLCESPNLEVLVPLGPTPIADHYIPEARRSIEQRLYPLDLALCYGCGHVQLVDVVSPEMLFVDYIYQSSFSPGLIDHFKSYADALVARFSPKPGSLVMDIGSNIGALLKFFKAHHLTVLGIDPAREIAARATAEGVETLPTFFSSTLAKTIRAERGAATIITANNVFAHSDALPDMADGVRELLAHDGVFVFEVNYLIDVLQNMLFDTVYHEHLCYHSIHPLQKFLAKHGLQLIDAEHVTTKGGSLRCVAQLQGGPRTVQPSIATLLQREDALKLRERQTYVDYAKKIQTLKSELHACLKARKAREHGIAGFGASATVTTLLYHFELGSVIDYIVDDNTTRHGLLSPGLHLPILSPEALYERTPGHVIVLAWRFADPIMRKHAKYREQGGTFVVPVPKLVINGM